MGSFLLVIGRRRPSITLPPLPVIVPPIEPIPVPVEPVPVLPPLLVLSVTEPIMLPDYPSNAVREGVYI